MKIRYTDYTYDIASNISNSLIGEILTTDSQKEYNYWIASRSISRDAEAGILYEIRYVKEGTITSSLLTLNGGDNSVSSDQQHYIRPIIELNDNLTIISGKGSKEEPYKIQ